MVLMVLLVMVSFPIDDIRLKARIARKNDGISDGILRINHSSILDAYCMGQLIKDMEI